MPKHCYDPDALARLRKNAERMAMITHATTIIEDYQAQGFTLTLRQLYYQFVSRDLIPNRQTEYKRLGDIIVEGRMAGLVDWTAIIDRTRNLETLAHWDDVPDIVDAISQQFRVDKWQDQPNRVEVWIEKDALVGVIQDVCEELDVPYFSCRGYTSISEVWSASQRLLRYKRKADQTPIILHFGDHDPSGIDMTRDIRDRLRTFGLSLELRRLALNRDQIDQYHPPPNPAKTTDSRYAGYIALHGTESWELDALEPQVLAALIRDEITELIDTDKWDAQQERIDAGRAQLAKIADRFDDVIDHLED
jgi:hypothetical protein